MKDTLRGTSQNKCYQATIKLAPRANCAKNAQARGDKVNVMNRIQVKLLKYKRKLNFTARDQATHTRAFLKQPGKHIWKIVEVLILRQSPLHQQA